MNFSDFIGLTDGFFLLFLAVSGNFIAETLGCETQFLFSNNLVVKQVIVFLILFFTINLTSKKNVAPKHDLIRAFALWLFFLLFTKMSVNFTLVVLMLLMSIFIIEKQKAYVSDQLNNNSNNKFTKKDIDNLEKYQKILLVLSLILVSIGFVRYYNARKREYKSSFKLNKFLFGVNKCKSLKGK